MYEISFNVSSTIFVLVREGNNLRTAQNYFLIKHINLKQKSCKVKVFLYKKIDSFSSKKISVILSRIEPTLINV